MNDYFDPEGSGSELAIIQTQSSMVVQLAQAELNQAVTTARAFPRSIKKAVDSIISLATLDAETAAECIYALPRGGKPIKGPSVRFAEIVAAMYGNCHVGSRVVAVDRVDKVVIAEGVFLDLETGLKRVSQVQRRISDKNGKLFNDDMIAVTGNAATSVAMREAVLKGVPKAIWRRAYEAADRVTLGTAETLVVRRDKAVKAFAGFGVTPEQIFASLEVGGLDDIGLEEISVLTAMFKSIKSEEARVETYFPPKVDPLAARQAAKGTARQPVTPQPVAKTIEKPPVERTVQTTADVATSHDPDTGEVEPDPEPAPKTSAPVGRAPKPAPAAQDEPATEQAGLPLGDPEQQTASGPSLDEIEARWQSKLRQMHADFESSGADAVLDLWADHLEKLKDEAPHLHAALMADLGLTTG
jgi:hypothetical protein